MAYYYPEPSHTFSEYLLIPGYTSEDCIPDKVSLRTPLVKYRKGQEECPISLNIPMVSAIMQSVSNDTLAIALAKEGGLSFIYGSQSIEDEAAMVARVKSHKAGFVVSASNLTPDNTLADVLALKEEKGFSTMAITEDASPNGRLLGIVKAAWILRAEDREGPVEQVMKTPAITARPETSIVELLQMVRTHDISSIPVVDRDEVLRGLVTNSSLVTALSNQFLDSEMIDQLEEVEA